MTMSFRRILIAVDSEPIAAHAADVGVELARSLGADVALIHAIDTSPGYGADTGISPNELIDQAKQDGKRLLEGFHSGCRCNGRRSSSSLQGRPPTRS
jgi:nucleotide-binding universal stress UspA family protein